MKALRTIRILLALLVSILALGSIAYTVIMLKGSGSSYEEGTITSFGEYLNENPGDNSERYQEYQEYLYSHLVRRERPGLILAMWGMVLLPILSICLWQSAKAG